MPDKKRIQIFIDHDIMIRHFVMSGVLRELEKFYIVQYVFPEASKRVKVDVLSLNLPSVKFLPINDYRAGQLRRLAEIKKVNIDFFVPEHKRRMNLNLMFGAEGYQNMRVRAIPGVFKLFETYKLLQLGRNKSMEEVVSAFDPDIILHPSVLNGVFIADLIQTAGHFKKPLLTLMNSWDNPSAKTQVFKSLQYLAVWGEQTERDAIECVGMNPKNIFRIGAAQFDVFRHPPLKSRTEICRELNIDENNRIILYCGSSKAINETKHLRILEQAVEAGKIARCKVIFRPHPWRSPAADEEDFFSINWKHTVMDPTMKKFYISPLEKDSLKMHMTSYEDTHSMLSAADLVVSNVSTISLEGALHGKPICSFVSDEELRNNKFLKLVYEAGFYREFVERVNLIRCKSHIEIADVCSDLLDKGTDPVFVKNLLSKMRFFVELDKESYSEKLLKLIAQLLQNSDSKKGNESYGRR